MTLKNITETREDRGWNFKHGFKSVGMKLILLLFAALCLSAIASTPTLGANVTYYAKPSSSVSIATGITTDHGSCTDPSSAYIEELSTSSGDICGSGNDYRWEQSSTGTHSNHYYNTAYSSDTDVTGVSYQVTIRDGGTVGFQLFYVDSGGTKTYLGTEVTQTNSDGSTNNYIIDLSGQSGTAPSGTKLGLRTRGTVVNPSFRIYIGNPDGNTGNISGKLIVDETVASDSTPPADVSNLATGAVTDTTIALSWTAPGDDGSSGTATSYDIRYSTSTITDGNWASATQATGEPAPSVAGSSESFTVTGLSASTTYYFAIKTSDEESNTSGLSNVPNATTDAPDTTPPADVSNLATGTVTDNSVALSWTAPGDDGSSGTATTYDIRYSTSTITDGNWASATQATGEPSPSVAGSSESFTVTGLSSATTYYFAIKTTDNSSNTSGLSNVPNATTDAADTTAPAAITDLAPSGTPTQNWITLTWTSPGDDNNSGTADAYDIRYSTSTITDANWASATQVTGEPSPLTAGSTEFFTVTGLSPNTQYYFAIKTSDEVPNTSAISNVANDTTASGGGGGDCIVDPNGTYIEAENFTGTINQGSATFVEESSIGGYNGSSYLRSNGGGTASPPGHEGKQYQMEFNTTGTYYVWMRGYATSSSDNSFFIGLNGSWTGALTELAYNQWLWTKDIQTGANTISVGSTGTNTFNGWVREPNHEVDGFYLTTSSGAIPGGTSGGIPTGAKVINPATCGGDVTAPATVSDMATGTVTTSSIQLSWTAPGDDGSTGTASTYDIRYSTSTITSGNWASATQATGEPSPSSAGSSESFTVTGLSSDTTYYFAIKTSDEIPNTSGLSNVPNAATLDATAPADVSDLATGTVADNSIDLSWTAPGDDGSTGTATTYDIRYSTSTITSGNWASATQASGEPSPSSAGSSETFTVTGLSEGTTYYFAIKTIDDGSNTSGLSNVPNATTTTDTTPPADVSNLATGTVTDNLVALSWTAPGDDGSSGTATTYDIRYSTSTITDGNWASATQATGEPSPSVAGSSETFTVTSLSSGTTYYFAIKTTDSSSNTSGLSNVPNATTDAADVTAPSAEIDVIGSNSSTTTIDLDWTAPGDDGDIGTATSYDIRYSTSTITEGNWASATQISGEPSPSVAGSAESDTVTGLSSGTTYYFAIKTTDEASNTSALSNIAIATTQFTGGNATYYADPSSSVSIASGITTNHGSCTDPSGAYIEELSTSISDMCGSGSEYKWTQSSAGTYSNHYSNTAYAVDMIVTGVSYQVTIRDGGTVGFQLFYVTSGGSKTYLGTEVTQSNSDGNTNNYIFDLSGQSGTAPAGTKLGLRTRGTNTNPDFRIYIGNPDGRTSNISGKLIVDETPAPDTTAPSDVSDLAGGSATTTSLQLSWTAPGDDAGSGTASTYDVRYSTSTITDGNWASATQVAGDPAPSVAGSSESMTITGLSDGTTYYFAIKTADEIPNWSGLSNIPNATTVTAVYQPDSMIKLSSEGDGSYLTDGTYEASASVQVKSKGLISGSTAAYTIKFQNDANISDSLVITGTGDGSGFTVQYLDELSTDRTADVTGAGYTISSLAIGASKVWTMNVTPGGSVTGGSSYDVLVMATSNGNGAKTDQVKAATSSTSANLTMLKSADKATADPGEDISYTVTATNGSGLTDASNVAVTDPIPTNTGFKVGGASFNASTSTLSTTISYSDDNKSTWTYTPVDGACSAPTGYDYCVTHVKWSMTGNMPTTTNFSIGLVVRIK